MKNRPSRIRLLQNLYHRFAVYFYLFLAVVLIIFGFSKHPAIREVRSYAGDFSSTVVSILYKPFRWIGEGFDQVADLLSIRQANQKLREENRKLLYWINRAEQLKQENVRLKKELNFVEPEASQNITGYIVADNGGTFSRSVLVRAGRRKGVRRGFVAMYNDGVLGHIEAVGEHASQLLLLTDVSSRVPVVVGEQRLLGIVSGNNTGRLKLINLPEGAQVKEGDYISTSGHSGVYPAGLAIGSVCEIEGKDIWVRPFVRREDTSFVQLFDFKLDGLLDVSSCGENDE